MEDRERQALVDQLGDVLGQMFAAGLDEASDEVKHAVLTGLQKQRVVVSVQVAFGPAALACNFGVTDSKTGAERVVLFEIVSPKSLVVDQVGPASEIVN